MSRYTLEEEEQIANLKAWWAKYGNFILTVFILVFGGIAANNGWKWWQARQATESVVAYEKLEKALSDGNVVLVGQIQNTLRDEHSSSPYAQRGALLAAKALFDQGKLDQAKSELQWAVNSAKLDEYTATAALMLSAILIEEGQFDQAKALLNKNYAGFAGLFNDRKGDIAVAQQDFSAAKTEYEAALKALQSDSPWKQVVERKIAALPKTGEKKE